MTATVTAHDDGNALATLWFLITQAGPPAAATGPSRQRAAALHLRYRPIRIPRTRRWGEVQLLTGLTWRVSPMSDDTGRDGSARRPGRPDIHIDAPGGTTTKILNALLADLDVADANAAVIQLGRRQRHIAAAYIRNDVRAIRDRARGAAAARLPIPDAGPDNLRHYRAELLDIVAAIASGRRQAGTRRPGPATSRPYRPLEAPPQSFSPRGLPAAELAEGRRPGSEGEGTPVPPKRQTCRRAYVRSTSHGRRDRHHRRRQPDR
jgi:hypothetical protein